MADQVLPSKLVDERITVRFEFMDELEWGETIESWSVAVQVLSGIDTSPDLMLYRQAIRVETLVSQQIQEGTPGVIYQVVCTVTGSTGAVYQKVAKLSILPTEAQIPPIIATFYTSRPYPIVVEEALTDSSLPNTGWIFEQPEDAIGDSSAVVSGTLVNTLVLYEFSPDAVGDSSVILSGDLYTGRVEYIIGPDAVGDASDILSGTLVNTLITYDRSIDAVSDSSSIISGTLT